MMIAYLSPCLEAWFSESTLWSAVSIAPKWVGCRSPSGSCRAWDLHGARLIFTTEQTGQFMSRGKWVNKLCACCGSRFDLETLSRLRRLWRFRRERRPSRTVRRVSALVPVAASDALVSAEVGGCPSTTSSDVMLREGDDDELEDLDEFPLSSSSEVILHEKDGELE